LADPDIMQFAISIGVLRGGIEVTRGRVPVSDLPAWLILDGASRGLLAFAGGKAGAWLGLIAVGPAGALILGPVISAAAIMGNSTLKGYAQKQLMSDWHTELERVANVLQRSILVAFERRIAHLEERSRNFAIRASISDLDNWMSRRAHDDLIAACEDRASLIAFRPKAEVDAIQLLLSARDFAPADAAVLSSVHAVELTIALKPSLRAVMFEAARPAGDLLRSHLKGRWFNRS